jgi:glycosyltransferase involved in cell wall biosynthesis
MKNKTAIGILMNALDMGGAEKQSLLQAKLMGTEFDVHYIVQKKKPQLKQHIDFIKRENIHYIQLTGNIISRFFQLNAYIKQNEIKVLFAYLSLDNLLASLVSVFTKIIYVGGVRSSYLPFVKFNVTLVLQKYFLDYVIFNNHFGRDLFIKKGFLPSKSIVIQNCISTTREEIVREEGDKIKILSVGRFTPEKDYLTALKTIHLLNNKKFDKEIEYIIVGDGELYNQIQSWVENLKLLNVTIVRNPDKVGDYYIGADIYFLSSDSEGMPNSIMEAFNYSLPVVSTEVGDASYLVKDGQNGYLASTKDCERLAEKLSELISDSNKRNAFGKNGHSLLINEFSGEKYTNEYITFTNRILS